MRNTYLHIRHHQIPPKNQERPSWFHKLSNNYTYFHIHIEYTYRRTISFAICFYIISKTFNIVFSEFISTQYLVSA